MNILLTLTGFHDPYAKGLLGDEYYPGPILSLITEKSFDKIILFSTPNTKANTNDTSQVIHEKFSQIQLETIEVYLNDPTDYSEILRGVRTYLPKIIENNPEANFYISVASGTPQMHACWVLLTASGEIPARLLHVRPPKFVTKDRPLVSEIDLNLPEFPIIRAPIGRIGSNDVIIPEAERALKEIGIVGDHPLMKEAIETAAALAPSNVPIIIFGETGTGKELFARLIHRLSERFSRLFVAINCAAIPSELVESNLFGHKKGAFTGAITDQIGKFEVADKGTLFLDELGELPAPIQAKLLRVLQDGLIEPIGSNKTKKVDVRIIAATNKDLKRLVKEGKFREDLYYRLNVGEIWLPPLRKRKSDIPRIALHILDQINKSIRTPKRLSPDTLLRLQNHNWQGNVRDLSNVIERSARLCRKEVLQADDLLIGEPVTSVDKLDAIPDPYEGFLIEDYLNSIRKQLFLKALDATHGNQSKAAQLLGVTPQAVHKFIQSN